MLDFPLLHVFVLHAVTVVSPGPNFIVVAHAATTSSRLVALWTAVGVAAGAVLWALAAILGFGAIASSASPVYGVVKVLGAAYLVWHGVTLWRGPTEQASVGEDRAARGAPRALRRGLLTNLANPRSVVFFASVLSVALPREAGPGLRLAAVAIVGLDALVWYGSVAMLLARARLRAHYAARRRHIDRMAGLLMVGLAVSLPLG